jgi:hypothetical protein
MSSPVHQAKDIDPALIYAPPWAREQALAARYPVPNYSGPNYSVPSYPVSRIGEPPRLRSCEIGQRDFGVQPVGDSRAYTAAIECAALCVIAINSVGSGSFRQNLREALREALHLRCGFHEKNMPAVDDSEVRNVLSDVVARTLSLSQLLRPTPECDAEIAVAL